MQFKCHRKPCRMLRCGVILCTRLRHRSRKLPSFCPLSLPRSGSPSQLYRSSGGAAQPLRRYPLAATGKGLLRLASWWHCYTNPLICRIFYFFVCSLDSAEATLARYFADAARCSAQAARRSACACLKALCRLAAVRSIVRPVFAAFRSSSRMISVRITLPSFLLLLVRTLLACVSIH